MWILKELNVLLNRFICGESDEDTKSHAKVSLIQFFLASILIILPMVFFDVQMYTATAAEQQQVWHSSSYFISSVLVAISALMIFFTVKITNNLRLIESLMFNGRKIVFGPQSTLMFLTCFSFVVAYFCRFLIEIFYFRIVNYNMKLGDPNYWHWLTWPSLINDILPIFTMLLMHHINWQPVKAHNEYITLQPTVSVIADHYHESQRTSNVAEQADTA